MGDKLALLCEKQLHAAAIEADAAFNDIIMTATATLRLCQQLHTTAAGGAVDTSAIMAEMRKLLMQLQFHDELSQRLRHVIELCRLLAPAGTADDCDAALLHQVSGIFSTGSEFSVLQSVFPQLRHDKAGEAIELF